MINRRGDCVVTEPPRVGQDGLVDVQGRGRSAARLAGGAARILHRAASSMIADLASAAATGTEVGIDLLAGRDRDLATLRVEVVILSDEDGHRLCHPDAVQSALTAADRLLTEYAGVRVRVTGIRVISGPAWPEALDARANRDLLLDEIAGRTAFYRRLLPVGSGRAIGAPITVFVVRSIAGLTTGCSLGGTADWVVVRASLFDRTNPSTYDETVLAHELGHAMNLPHHGGPDNLMISHSSPPQAVRGTRLTHRQAAVIRANRHVLPGRVRARPAVADPAAP